MARRGHAYPNVRVVAADLVNARLGHLPPRANMEAGLARAGRLHLTACTVGPGRTRAVLRDDLRRAVALGLGEVAAARVARDLPAVGAEADEVAVRRQFAEGAPLVLVRGTTGGLGAIAPVGAMIGGVMGPSLARRLDAILDDEGHRLLRRLAGLAEGQGGRAFLVGGAVRDAVANVTPATGRDLDVVVEGDGVAVAHRLAAEIGWEIDAHARFLTASLFGPGERRLDVATARTEHYEAPGALPQVRAAGLAEDLARRDFTVNAMAAELSSGAFCLVDPLGGQQDLARRRLRILHPLSFVEDPTRLFRGARYAIRLGLAPDRWTAGCRDLALDLAPFNGLSGTRLAAELALVLREPRPARVVTRLGEEGVFRLFARRYRYTQRTAARLPHLARTTGWARSHGLSIAPIELLALVLFGDQTPGVVAEGLGRLGVSGVPAKRLRTILRIARAQRARLGGASSRSAAARLLRGRPALELAWLWMNGDREIRRRVTRYAARDGAVVPWLDGDEIMALGVPRGPAVARILDALRDGRLDGTLRNRDAATAHVRRWAVEGGDRRTRGRAAGKGG